jgi:hypothetical protein
LGRIHSFPQWVRSPSLNSFVYQRVTTGGFSNLLEDSAPALPVIGRSFADQRSLSHWLSCVSVLVVTGWCDEKSQGGLVWGIPLLAFEKRLADNP